MAEEKKELSTAGSLDASMEFSDFEKLLNEEFKTTDELQTALYSVVKDGVLVDKELKQTQKRYFQILYNMLLGKDQGPKLGLFLMAIDKEKIKSLL